MSNPLDGSDPLNNHEKVERELTLHDARLAALPRVLALSKADLVDEETLSAAREQWRARLGDGVAVIATSSATGAGLDQLGATLVAAVPREQRPPDVPAPPGAAPPDPSRLAEHRTFRPASERSFEVNRVGEAELQRERASGGAPRAAL